MNKHSVHNLQRSSNVVEAPFTDCVQQRVGRCSPYETTVHRFDYTQGLRTHTLFHRKA